MRKLINKYPPCVLIIYSVFFCTISSFAQKNCIPSETITVDSGYTARSVRVEARWISEELLKRLQNIVKVGSLYHPSVRSEAAAEVRNAILESEEKFAIQLVGATSILYVTSEVCADVTSKQVDIIIQPYYLRIDLVNIGNNVLPVPRSAKPTLFTHVPSVLSFTSPVFSVFNDRRFGVAPGIQLSTDLLNLPSRLKSVNTPKPVSLIMDLGGRKALNSPFYDFNGQISLKVTPTDFYKENNLYDLIEQSSLPQRKLNPTQVGWSLTGQYTASYQPLGLGENRWNKFNIQGETQGKWNTSFFKKWHVSTTYAFGAGVRFQQNDFTSSEAKSRISLSETGMEFYALTDGSIADKNLNKIGFTRLGLWFDAANPKTSTPYQRLSGRIGYATELGRTHRSWGLEAMLGAGHSWGSPPDYNAFFGGNATWNFLYDSFASTRYREAPSGPVLRSAGLREAALINTNGVVHGGTSYWHLNVNLSIAIDTLFKRSRKHNNKKPITLIRPLIPDVIDSSGIRPLSLRNALKSASGTAQSNIQLSLETDGLSPDDAQKKAKEIVDRDIRPPLEYLADRATIYAIKPLLLFDIAQLSNRDGQNQLWPAAGIGLQLNIVVARFEGGYLHSLNSDLPTGNFFLRLTIQNFF